VTPFFNTDKIWDHGYFPAYLGIARELGQKARVCEIGVQTGESLRMWQALFPMGEVTGIDIDPQAVFPPGTERVISAQDDPHLAGLGPFDLIVDDASHDGTLTRKTFEILWPRVNPGGFYVVEDWFFGIKPWRNGTYDPVMLETVQHFLTLLSADGDGESVYYRYGLAVLRKKLP
jgi:predicted O-methyltransferase YrrM